MRFTTLLFTAILSTSLTGQISVESTQVMSSRAIGKLDKKHIEALRRTTTLFFLRPGDDDLVDQVQTRLNSVWTISPIEVHPYFAMKDVLEKYRSRDLSFITIGAYLALRDGSPSSIFAYLDLFLFYPDKNDKMVRTYLARAEMHMSGKSTKDGMYEINSEDLSKFLYEEAVFHNWHPGIAVNYIQYINGMLEKGSPRTLWESNVNERALATLRKAPLYILDNVAISYNRSTMDESPVKDPSALFKAYPYPYELISAENLGKKLLAQEESFLYMVYVFSGGAKYLAIFKSDTGELVYAESTRASYSFKAKDMAKIAAYLKK